MSVVSDHQASVVIATPPPETANISHNSVPSSLSVLQTARLVWRGARSAPEYWPLCVMSLLSALLSGPFILSIYTDYAFGVMTNQPSERWGWLAMQPLWLVSALALVLLVVGTISDYAVNNLAAIVNVRVWRHNISRLFGEAIRIQANANNQLSLHSVKSLLADSVEVFQRHQLYVLQNSLRSLLIVFFTLIYLLAHNPWFVVVVCAALGLTFGVPIWLAAKAQPAIDEEPFALHAFNHFLLSILRLGGLLAYNDNRHLFRQIESRFHRYIAIEGKKWLIWNFAFNFKVTLNLLTSASLLAIGGSLYFFGFIEMAELIAVYLLTSNTIPRLDSLYKIFNYFQSLKSYYQQSERFHEWSQLDRQSTIALETISRIELDCKSLHFPHRSQPSFKNIFMQFERGKVYLLRGESGSGKTTLLNMLLGFQQPDRGQLLVNGSPMTAAQLPAYWQRVALHEQKNLLIADLTAMENIQLVKRPIHHERFEQAKSVLGLAQWGDKPVKLLSGGEVQRLCFLRAYIYVADVFVFDEPTSALDHFNEKAIQDLLAQLRDAIVLIVSHNQVFSKIADYLLTLHADGHWQSERGGRPSCTC